jgi:hypothetical protein
MTTTTTTRTPAPKVPMTDLRLKVYAWTLRGRRTVRYAESVDGSWDYQWTGDPDAPWVATFRPTDQEAFFGSLTAARRWSASPAALAQLAAEAQRVINASGRRGEVIWPLNQYGKPYRYEVPEDPADCAARVAEARHQLRRIQEVADRATAR